MRSPRTTNTARAHSTRAGTVLVLFVVLVFALLGVAALAIDMGFASLSQAQMQTAADTAALEGVRLRDFYEYRSQGDPYRRPRVSELVQQVFDDDFHPTTGTVTSTEPFAPPALPPDDDDALKLGAGPIYRTSGGIGDAQVGQLLEVPDSAASMNQVEAWVDDPRLHGNARNLAHGDMLSGRYNVFAEHREQADYLRDDFTPAPTTPTNPYESWRSIGFLVRLRRTTGDNPLDEASGISTRGFSLPFLFGMGAGIRGSSTGYNPRRDGLTVRAAAIAVGRPALSAGPQPRNLDGSPLLDRIGRPMRGVGYWYFPGGTGAPELRRHVTVAWAKSFWADTLPDYSHDPIPEVGSTQTLRVRADGAVEFRPNASLVEIVGHLMVAPCDQTTETSVCRGSIGTCAGDFVGMDLSQPPYSLSQAELHAIVQAAGYSACYMPVYASIAAPGGGSSKRIVGYVYGGLSGGAAGNLSIAKGLTDGTDEGACQVIIAPDNASATLSRQSAVLAASEWNQIFEQCLQFAYPNGNPSYAWQNVRPGTVLAPVLAR